MFWNSIAKPLLFLMPAETAHFWSMAAYTTLLKAPGLTRGFSNWYSTNDPRLAVDVCGIRFANPVGLAAGFDKNAAWYHELECLGFGHIEVGTITGESQRGNEKPRLFRLTADNALINRMGFNNVGAEEVAAHLARRLEHKPAKNPLGINIGKTKAIPDECAIEDYLKSFRLLFSLGNYFTINVSSPNTPGLRKLQNREQLLQLIPAITELNTKLANQQKTHQRPIFLKIAPDISDYQLDDFQHIVEATQLNGIIATNTSVSRINLKTKMSKVESIGAGGVSGEPLKARSRKLVQELYKRVGDQIPIIGVGGIQSGHDAWQMILAGASLVQIYTGFIYGGPNTVKKINQYLLKKIEHHDLQSISAAIGKFSEFPD